MTATVDERRTLPRQRFAFARGRSIPSPLLAAIVLLVLWEVGAWLLASTSDRLAPMKLPYPHEVLRALINNIALLFNAALDTAMGALIGLVVGTITGVLIALLMAQARWVEDASYPYIVGAQMIPTVALAPIIFGAVHDPTVTKVIVAAYISVFAVSLGTIKGLKSTPIEGLALMRSLNADRSQVMRKLRIPAALPFFFAGLRVAAPLAVIGEIVVELAGSKDGLGTLMITTQYYGVANAHLFWATLAVTLLLGYLFALGASLLERTFASWQPAYRGGGRA
jgi:NitT/TauT family transport system permease protein